MAEQATGTVDTGGSTAAAVGAAHTAEHEEHNPGRPISWVSISIIIVGFVVGGVAFVPHPTWWLVYVGGAIAIVGCIMTAFAKTFSQDWY